MSDNTLGDFLRARRSGLRPEDVGMASYGVRRVAGLRREEVAVLAGVNVDYYTRLEQGRERHPSSQVLDALSRALQLDTDARAHLHRLAGIAPNDRPVPQRNVVSPALRQLMDGYSHTPAFVVNGALDILAANALADALYSPFDPRTISPGWLSSTRPRGTSTPAGTGPPRPPWPTFVRRPVVNPTTPG